MSTLLIDLEGHELKQEEVELLEHPSVAGLILFTRNFYDRQQVQALIKSIREKAFIDHGRSRRWSRTTFP